MANNISPGILQKNMGGKATLNPRFDDWRE